MKPIHALVIGVVWGAGCGGDPYREITGFVYDPCEMTVIVPAADASALQRQAIAAAIELWQAVGGPPLTMADVADAQYLAIGFEDAAPFFRGVYQPERGDILINRSISEPTALAIIVAHEMGHAFGLEHDDRRPSIMNKANLTIAPNALDAAAVFAERSSTCVAGGSTTP